MVSQINALRDAEQEMTQAEQLLADPEMRELATVELEELKSRLPSLHQAVRLALLPRDVADERSAILEIRPAAGGMRLRCSLPNCSTFTVAMPN